MRSVIHDKRKGLALNTNGNSTTGFQAALGESDNRYRGGMLDAQIKNQISSRTTGIYYLTNGGPGYGVLFMKASNSYYGGIVFSYNNADILLFRYVNGTCWVHTFQAH